MLRRADPKLKNRHTIAIGKTGCGKSTWIKNNPAFLKAKRVIIWDPDEEYTVESRFRNIGAFAQYIQAQGDGPLRVALTVMPDQPRFDLFCRVVWAQASCTRRTLVLVEELSTVTTPQQAPKAWGIMCRQGRKYGLELWAVTQRPVMCDKLIYTQAGCRWLSLLDDASDITAVAKLAKVPEDQYRALQGEPDKFTEYLYVEPGKPVVKKRVDFTKL